VDQVGERVVWHRIGDDGLHGRVFVFLSVVSYFQDTAILPLVVFFSLSLSRSDGIFGSYCPFGCDRTQPSEDFVTETGRKQIGRQ